MNIEEGDGMREMMHVFRAFLFCLITLLLAELFCQIPQGTSMGISLFYLTEILLTALCVPETSCSTVRYTDLGVGLVLFLIQRFSILRSMNADQKMTVLYAILVSTVSFGCNRRYDNRLKYEKNLSQAGKD